jgi:hypothetical protein
MMEKLLMNNTIPFRNNLFFAGRPAKLHEVSKKLLSSPDSSVIDLEYLSTLVQYDLLIKCHRRVVRIMP